MRKSILISLIFPFIFQLVLYADVTADDYLPHLDNKYGKILLNMRWRYENVEQDGVKNAEAITIRTRLGYQTPVFFGFSGLAELEHTIPFNSGTYRSPGLNNALNRAVIADPRNTELNRAQLTYTGINNTTVILGRQRIKLDNVRFIGNVGWRQNEQTYDAVTIKNNSIKNLQLYYGYLKRVNRVFGRDAKPYRGLYYWNMDTHIVNIAYTPCRYARLVGYAYLTRVETRSARSNSNDTYGAYLSGKYPVAHITLSYRIEYATQKDNSKSPSGTSFDLDYYHFKLGGFCEKSKIDLGVGYEILEGNGTRGFSTPLATLHAFQGWADKFLATPANGMEDLYTWAGIRLPYKIMLKTVYHKFEAENSGANYGDEIDFLAIWKIDNHFKLLGKYAHYSKDDFGADTNKVIMELNFIY